jgi:hypothetical protein
MPEKSGRKLYGLGAGCIGLSLLLLFCSVPGRLEAKQQSLEPVRKRVEAARLDEPVKIDGLLDEGVWQGPGYSDFVQADPHDGQPPTEKTTVWVAYDDKALYVAARLEDSQPDKIVSRLGRRDDCVAADWFGFDIDTYFDRRSGFWFSINPSGSIADGTLYNDEWDDLTWDGVWLGKTHIDEKGWTAELRIPFHQFRFKKQKDSTYVWGVNFRRVIQRKNEEITFVRIPKGESGYVSRFARLEGITGINPGRYIEMLPFTVGKAEFTTEEKGNPFKTGEAFLANTGLDLKVGLKSNLILDAAINPDFGQVEVDPAVINLSALETYYEEKRPFFVEGANIFVFGRGGANDFMSFDWGDPAFFYSRRIGRSPRLAFSFDDAFVNYPEGTTILAAAKVTGKIGRGWNIGFLNALTAREYAQIDIDGERLRHEAEPFSYYGVLRALKEFNQGSQGLGMITTVAARDLKSEKAVNELNKNAFGFAVDGWTALDRDKTWVLTGWLGGTLVSGSEAAILALQRSYPHYFQRPDATQVMLDEDATAMSGWAGRVTLNKQKGHLLFNAALGAVSPGFDPSDLGFLWEGDVINGHIGIGYHAYRPGKLFRNWLVLAATHRNYDFGGSRTGEAYYLISKGQLLNYWNWEVMMGYYPDSWCHIITRGGPLMKDPSFGFTRFNIASDTRKPVSFSCQAEYFKGRTGLECWLGELDLEVKPNSNFTFTFGPSYERNRSDLQWVANIEDPLMTDTYGTRHIFASIDQQTLSAVIRVNWIFTPALSLQLFLQPFISVGKYRGFKEFARSASLDFNYFGTGGGGEPDSTILPENNRYRIDPDGPGPAEAFYIDNPDFNYKSLRGTVVLRWEFKPRSILYLVWTQNRADTTHPGDLNFSRDFSDLLRAPGTNIIMIKFSYRFQL